MMAKEPGFTAAAVITLALGAGAATSIFSVTYNVLLDPFPYKDAGDLSSSKYTTSTKAARTGGYFSPSPNSWTIRSRITSSMR